jgi:hypothetical protein
MQCPVCEERKAAAQYYRLNRLSEQVEHLCRPCWLTLKRAAGDDWRYFQGAARLVLLYTVIPTVATALVVWLLAMWLL